MRKPLAACFVTAVLIGCGSDPEITAVRIVASYSQAISVDQLAFAVGTAGELRSFDAAIVRPQKAASPLRSPQSFVVYLPDRLAGMTVVCGVRGRRGGTAVVEGWGRPVELVLKNLVTCEVLLEDGQSGPDGGLPPMGDGGADDRPVDGSRPFDGPPGADVPITDGRPAVDGPPPPDGSPPRDAAPTGVDVARDRDPPDARPDDAMAPPPDAPASAVGCAVGDRKAFINPSFFPRVAGCGASPMSYSRAVETAGKVCADGWHWCSPQEMAALSSVHLPGQESGSSCSWLDSQVFACEDRREEHPRLGCTGSVSQTSSVGGPTSAAACTLGLGCGDPWKFVVPLDRFNASSVSGRGSPCMNHVAFQCAGTLMPSNCWITCCKDP